MFFFNLVLPKKYKYALENAFVGGLYRAENLLKDAGGTVDDFIAYLKGFFEKEAIAGPSEAGIYSQYLPLPTLANFATSLYYGSASVSYPIKTPPGPGGISPPVSLGYSSSSVDGFMNFIDTNKKNRFIRQSGAVGLGWGIGGGNFQISIDTHGQEDDPLKDSCMWTWNISFPGGSAELVKVNSTTGRKVNRCIWDGNNKEWVKNTNWQSASAQWATDPEIFIKVISAPSGYVTKGGRWVIKTADNSQYVFGEDDNSTYTYPDATRVTNFVHVWGLWQAPPQSMSWLH